MAGAGAADEVRELEQLIGVPPGDHPGQRVRAGDEVELGVRTPLSMQVAQRVDGVGLPRPVDVDPADGEPRVRRCRDYRHQVAVLGGRNYPVLLLPRPAGGHENDLIQAEVVPDLTGRDQVPMMDRVESAAHHAEPLAHAETLDAGNRRSVVSRRYTGLRGRLSDRVGNPGELLRLDPESA